MRRFSPVILCTLVLSLSAFSAQAEADAKDLRNWLMILGSSSPMQQKEPLAYLEDFYSKNPNAFLVIAAALEDKDGTVRLGASMALSQLAPCDCKAIPFIVRALKEDPSVRVRLPCVRTLARIAVESEKEARAKGVFVALMQAAKEDKDTDIRARAVYAFREIISEISPDSAVTIPFLKDLLTDPEPRVRIQAYLAIAELGDAERAIPLLVNAVTLETDKGDLMAIACGLTEFRKEGSNALAVKLKDKTLDKILRSRYALVLGMFRHHSHNRPDEIRESVMDIAAMLSDRDLVVRRNAAESLADLDDLAEDAAPSLNKAIGDPDAFVRSKACYALSRLGPKAVVALESLRKALTDQSSLVRRHAVLAVGGLGQEGKAAVPDLVDALKREEHDHIKWTIVDALKGIGVADKRVIMSLTEILNDEKATRELKRRAKNALDSLSRDKTK